VPCNRFLQSCKKTVAFVGSEEHACRANENSSLRTIAKISVNSDFRQNSDLPFVGARVVVTDRYRRAFLAR